MEARTKIALVFGAGGAYGWIYHTGVLQGLKGALDMDPNEAELIIGTSAGAAIGAAVRAGVESEAIVAAVSKPPTEQERRAMLAELREARKTVVPFAPRLFGHAISTQGSTLVGLAGLLPPGVFPTSWLARFPGMDDHAAWPRGLWVPAVSAVDGEVVVFGRDRHDVDVHRAAQASSAVPGMFQPHVIDGVPYLDGGLASPTHAHLAREVDPDLVIVSSPMTRPGRRLTAGYARRALAAEVTELERTGARVVVVEPGPLSGDLAKGYPRRNGHHAPEIVDRARSETATALQIAGVVPSTAAKQAG